VGNGSKGNFKKRLIEQGRLSKHGKPNEKTPDYWYQHNPDLKLNNLAQTSDDGNIPKTDNTEVTEGKIETEEVEDKIETEEVEDKIVTDVEDEDEEKIVKKKKKRKREKEKKPKK